MTQRGSTTVPASPIAEAMDAARADDASRSADEKDAEDGAAPSSPSASSSPSAPSSPRAASALAAALDAPLVAGAVAMSATSRAAHRPSYVPAGTMVDHKYAILRVLGEGGMGVVYLARDIHTGVDVVLKAVRPELADRSDVRARTLAEGRALAQIDHPNVVHLKAVVLEEQGLWLVMQYIDGESLDRRIDRYIEEKRPMPLAEVRRIFRQIVAGIDAAHQEGVIHRDLKPANVLIRQKDEVAKVTDFGIAKIEEDARAGKGLTKGIIGSLWYMSPEQVTGRRDLDKRVDIYSLGIVLYEMLVGRVPFDADDDYAIMRQHLSAPVPRVSAMRRDVPESVDAIIQRACAKQREDRFAGCDELLRALDALTVGDAGDVGEASTTGDALNILNVGDARRGLSVGDAETAGEPAASTQRVEPSEHRVAATSPDRTAEEGNAAQPSRIVTTTDAEPVAPRRRRRSRALLVAIAILLVAGLVFALFALGVIPRVPWPL